MRLLQLVGEGRRQALIRRLLAEVAGRHEEVAGRHEEATWASSARAHAADAG